jgi:hypothetical protein
MLRYVFTGRGSKRVQSHSLSSACLTVLITHLLIREPQNTFQFVIPAKAGIQKARLENAWIPAYAPKVKGPMAQQPCATDVKEYLSMTILRYG